MLQESINKHPNIYDIHHLVDSQQFVQTNLVLNQETKIQNKHPTRHDRIQSSVTVAKVWQSILALPVSISAPPDSLFDGSYT